MAPTLVWLHSTKSTDPGSEREERVVWNMEGAGTSFGLGGLLQASLRKGCLS